MARGVKSGGASAEARSTSTRSLLDWFFRPAMLFRVSLVAGAIALWPYAAQRLPSLHKRPEYQFSFSRIQISPPPARPVPENLLEQVGKQTEVPHEFSVLDEHLTAELADAFSQHPWVANVVRVRKSFPAAVVVELEYRHPVAMVQVPGGRVPIDIDAIVLPSADFSTSDLHRYPLIRNVSTKPATRPGTAWQDPALIAAARLAKLLGSKWSSLKLEAIVIPATATAKTNVNDVPLELIGEGGSRIIWGRTPDSDHPGELEPNQKIRRLEKYLADFGNYGQPKGPYEIDIRHWQEISRRPLAVEQDQSKPTKPTKVEARHHPESKRKTRS